MLAFFRFLYVRSSFIGLVIVSIANCFIISPYMEKPKTIDLIAKRGLLPCVLLQMLCITSKAFIFALYVQLLE